MFFQYFFSHTFTLHFLLNPVSRIHKVCFFFQQKSNKFFPHAVFMSVRKVKYYANEPIYHPTSNMSNSSRKSNFLFFRLLFLYTFALIFSAHELQTKTFHPFQAQHFCVGAVTTIIGMIMRSVMTTSLTDRTFVIEIFYKNRIPNYALSSELHNVQNYESRSQ